jgi:hypothetical protein
VLCIFDVDGVQGRDKDFISVRVECPYIHSGNLTGWNVPRSIRVTCIPYTMSITGMDYKLG